MNLRAAELEFGFTSEVTSNLFFGISDVQKLNSSYLYKWNQYSVFLIFHTYRILKSMQNMHKPQEKQLPPSSLTLFADAVISISLLI